MTKQGETRLPFGDSAKLSGESVDSQASNRKDSHLIIDWKNGSVLIAQADTSNAQGDLPAQSKSGSYIHGGVEYRDKLADPNYKTGQGRLDNSADKPLKGKVDEMSLLRKLHEEGGPDSAPKDFLKGRAQDNSLTLKKQDGISAPLDTGKQQDLSIPSRQQPIDPDSASGDMKHYSYHKTTRQETDTIETDERPGDLSPGHDSNSHSYRERWYREHNGWGWRFPEWNIHWPNWHLPGFGWDFDLNFGWHHHSKTKVVRETEDKNWDLPADDFASHKSEKRTHTVNEQDTDIEVDSRPDDLGKRNRVAENTEITARPAPSQATNTDVKLAIGDVNGYMLNHPNEAIEGAMLDLTKQECNEIGQIHVFNYINVPKSLPERTPLTWNMATYFIDDCPMCVEGHNTFQNMTVQGKIIPGKNGGPRSFEGSLTVPGHEPMPIHTLVLWRKYPNYYDAKRDEDNEFQRRFVEKDYWGWDDRATGN